MATPTGTWTTHTAVGVREDLEDVIYDISPMDTPLLSNISRMTVEQPYHEWQSDSLAAASAANANIEGDDANVSTSTATNQWANRCQIATKVPRVSGTIRSSDTAGRADELSYQIAKRGRELKRDIEMTLCGTQVATAGSIVSARACAGLAGWMFTNRVIGGSTGTVPVITSGAPITAMTAGTTAVAFTQEHLQSAIALAWTEGGDIDMVLMDAVNKRLASAFSGIATQYRDNQQAGPATIIGSADVFVSDFGQHALIASRFVPTDVVYMLDTEFLCTGYLRPIQQQQLAKTGDSDRALLLAEFTLVNKNPKAHAMYFTST